MEKQYTWEGTPSDNPRSLTLNRPCGCGCDERDGTKGVGYLLGMTEDGRGVTVWIEDEAVFERLAILLGGFVMPGTDTGWVSIEPWQVVG